MIISFISFFIIGGVLINAIPTPQTSLAHPIYLQSQLLQQSNFPPDVVFLGSSRTAFGINPETVDPVLSDAWTMPVKSFNYGLGCGNALTYRFAVNRLTNSKTTPIVAVYGISPTDVRNEDINILVKDVATGAISIKSLELYSDLSETSLKKELLLSATIPGRNKWILWQQLWICVRDGLPLIPGDYCYHKNGWLEHLNPRTSPTTEEMGRSLKRFEKIFSQPTSLTACKAFESALAELSAAGILTIVYEDPFPPYARKLRRQMTPPDYDQWLKKTVSEHNAILLPQIFTEATNQDFFAGAHVAPRSVNQYSRELAEAIIQALPASRIAEQLRVRGKQRICQTGLQETMCLSASSLN